MNYLTDLPTPSEVHAAVEVLQRACHGAAQHWWVDPKTGIDERTNPKNFDQKLLLIVSEIAESMEGNRKDLMDDKLPNRKMREVEMGDALIRLCDTAGGYDMDLAGAIVEKMAFNAVRPDHKTENRLADGGKAY
jgi:NTP pyrophosphatase (non-canonical NTP hydrolase)